MPANSAPSYDSASQGMQFHYVYILESEAHPDHYYVGLTENLRDRLSKPKPRIQFHYVHTLAYSILTTSFAGIHSQE